MRPEGPEISAVSAVVLRADLYAFADNLAASVAATADTIASQTTDRRIRELTVLWKLRVIPTVQRVVLIEDPRAGFLDVWAICVQARNRLQDNEDLGENHHLAVESAVRLEQAIERIGARFLSPEQMIEAKEEIERFAEGYPISGKFASAMLRASQATKFGFGRLSGVLSVPVSGLSDSAAAVDRLAHVAGVFTEVVQDMPERNSTMAAASV